jgi:hypothetical protein
MDLVLSGWLALFDCCGYCVLHNWLDCYVERCKYAGASGLNVFVGDDGPHPTDPVICLYSGLGFGNFSLDILLWNASMYLACTS